MATPSFGGSSHADLCAALAFLLPVLGTLLLLSPFSRPGLSADKPSPAELKEKVEALVDQMADKDAGKQDAAAVELIQLGPDARPLPAQAQRQTDRQSEYGLAAVRKQLARPADPAPTRAPSS